MTTPEDVVSPTSDAHRPQAPKHLGLALVVIATAQLMVVLDATIVNIALPRIEDDLGFSPANLQWVLTAYTLAFGGFLLLGGRAGDILGRRRVFMFGIILFTIGSLAGGFAWSEASLLVARAVQGFGAAFAAPTALSLIATEFPEGRPRNRAMGVYAAMSGAGAAIGLILGGLLTEWNWRWVLFVNVPIGIFIAVVAPKVLNETERHRGKFDLPGAITGTLGLGLLVYGLTHISTEVITQGASGAWTDPTSMTVLGLSVLLLIAFVVIEATSKHALMPLRIFENRNRAGAYAVMLLIAAAMFAMFFYLTLFVQNVLGYSALKAGFAFLPVSICIVIAAGTASQLITKFGAKPIAVIGTGMATLGMLWLAQIEPDSTYVNGLLGPIVVFALGLGFTFMPLTLTAVSQVDESDAGIASGVLNTTQQIGGSIGLAVLTTVSVTVFSNATGTGTDPVVATVAGWTRAFEVSAGMVFLAFIVTIFAIKMSKEEAAHAGPVGGAL